MKFMHAMIRVKNLEESMKFYTGLLDMNKTGEVELDDCTLYYLSDEDGQTQIEITYNKETPQNGYENGNAMPEVNMFIAFLKDPDGNEIEIMSDNM